MADEIFGPILPILTYKDMDAAIREVKRHPKPIFPASCLAATKRQSITSSRAWPLAAVQINQVNIHLFIENHALWRGPDIPALSHYYGSKAGFDALTHAEIGSHFAARRGHRAPVPAVYGQKRSKKRSASGLNTRPQRPPTRATSKAHKDENECERPRIDCPTVIHCLRCPRR